MNALLKAATLGLGLLLIGSPSHKVYAAANSLNTAGSYFAINTTDTYTLGDTTFSFTGCSTDCTALSIEAYSNGRGGTAVEIFNHASSYIYSKTSGSSNSSLNFTMKVTIDNGNQGIRSVTNILNGTDTVTSSGATYTSYNTRVKSVLSNFAGVTSLLPTTSITSNLDTSSTQATFTQLNYAAPPAAATSFTFKDTLSVNTSRLTPGYTLQLTNVVLLLNPAPEPASMLLLGTALAGLGLARRKRAI